jgi:hypothetical protein
MVKEFSNIYQIQRSLPCSQVSATAPCPVPTKYSPISNIISTYSQFNSILLSSSRSPRWSLPFRFLHSNSVSFNDISLYFHYSRVQHTTGRHNIHLLPHPNMIFNCFFSLNAYLTDHTAGTHAKSAVTPSFTPIRGATHSITHTKRIIQYNVDIMLRYVMLCYDLHKINKVELHRLRVN